MIILFLILVIFGPKNLPKIGQALGRGIREFKDAARGMNADLDDDDDDRPARKREQIAQKPEPLPETVSRSTTVAPDPAIPVTAPENDPIVLPTDADDESPRG
jgi:sec-independent protein translocase protein TatA